MPQHILFLPGSGCHQLIFVKSCCFPLLDPLISIGWTLQVNHQSTFIVVLDMSLWNVQDMSKFIWFSCFSCFSCFHENKSVHKITQSFVWLVYYVIHFIYAGLGLGLGLGPSWSRSWSRWVGLGLGLGLGLGPSGLGLGLGLGLSGLDYNTDIYRCNTELTTSQILPNLVECPYPVLSSAKSHVRLDIVHKWQLGSTFFPPNTNN